ncbi:MAG: hypothetical protein KatS3mg053_0652 [Candidatus Roseilinea sp.]|nr:MAG: hypothetical protein KatS3mg053_0652 [Candidatus Roseilinea sp.]
MKRKTSRRNVLKVASAGLGALFARFTILEPETTMGQSGEPSAPFVVNDKLSINDLQDRTSYQHLSIDETVMLFAAATVDAKYVVLATFLAQGDELKSSVLSGWQMVVDGMTSRILLIQLRSNAGDQFIANVLWTSSRDANSQSELTHVAAVSAANAVYVSKATGEIEAISLNEQSGNLANRLEQLQVRASAVSGGASTTIGGEVTTKDCSGPCSACAIYGMIYAFWAIFCGQGDPFACAMMALTCSMAGSACYECDQCNRCSC